jgi:hypothetical protein
MYKRNIASSKYRTTHKSINWLAKCTRNTSDIVLLFIEYTKIVQNEILHVQCTTLSAVIAFYRVTGILLASTIANRMF